MFTRELLLELHHRSHTSFNAIIGHAAALPDGSLTKELEGFGQENLREVLLHIAESEGWWIAQLTGQDCPKWDYGSFTSMQMVRDAFHDVAQQTIEYLNQQTNSGLGEVVRVSGEGWGFDTRPGWVVMHAITHGFHHKGQAATACRMLGNDAPDTDLGIGV